jgi:3-phenylpropionate/trans-cinnamate dioxygenase ferredoxin reductase component
MSPDRRTFVVVGANLAGGAAVTTLRERGFDGRIVLIGAEEHPPYERPPLSKAYLRGEKRFDDAILHPAKWYRDNDVDARFGVWATRIDPGASAVHLEDGTAVTYDRALLATGARNRVFDVSGRDLEGVLQLRTREDADRIRERARPGARAVIVGAGFIGCEVAASLRHLGVEIDVLDRGDVCLQRVLGDEAGRVVERLHQEHGVRFHHQCSVERFEAGGNGELAVAVTTTGERVECDLAVVGVGVEPVVDIVAGTAIQTDNGIVTDRFLRSSVPNVFAAGDVANAEAPIFGRHLRVEHWDNALKSGPVAAKNMLGEDVAYDEPHWFWSDQYDVEMQYAGHALEWDRFLVWGNLEARDFLGFYIHRGIIRGVLGMNRGRDVRRSMALVRAAAPVDEDDLVRTLDAGGDLRQLASRIGAVR